jgi:uncharacterized protein (DUF433 family)
MRKPVKTDPKIMHGTPCFAGTRVAIETLFDWLEEGQTLDYFLEQFPSVEREQALAVLEAAKREALRTAAAIR